MRYLSRSRSRRRRREECPVWKCCCMAAHDTGWSLSPCIICTEIIPYRCACWLSVIVDYWWRAGPVVATFKMLAAASTRGQLYFFFTNGAESSDHAGVYCVTPNLPCHWLMVDGKEMLIAPTVSAASSGARVLLLFLHASGAWNWSHSVKPVVKLRMGTRRSEGRDRD